MPSSSQKKHKEQKAYQELRQYDTSLVTRLVTRMMCPFIMMFGVSVISHGHLTPGGGFQGGVAIGASFILYALAFNKYDGRIAAPHFPLTCLAGSGIYIYIIVGLIGVARGYHFLANKVAGVPPIGLFGELCSGGTLFWINLGVGLSVASITTEMFFAFLEEEKPKDQGPSNLKLPYKRRWADVDKNDSL